MKKRIFSLLLALVMALSLLPTVAVAATTHDVANQEKFSDVCSKAVSGDTIVLGGGNFAIGPVAIDGKTLTFKGQGADKTTVYIGNGGYDGNGGHGSNKTANMTFEDLTLDDLASDAGYLTGFTEAAGLTFKNVTFNCGFSNWGNKGGNVSFYNCTFNQTNVEKYNVQELRSASNTHYLFDGCTFTSAGRFINAYKQGGKDVKIFVTVKDCTFNSTASKYAAVYLKNATDNKNDGCSVELRFMGTNTVTGTYVTDSKTGSPLYGEKGTSDATVYVNDVLVWANSKAVSTNFVEDEKGVYHIKNLDGLLEFRDAVNAGTSYSGKTVVLDADIDMTSVTAWTPIGSTSKNSFQGTFDGQNHKITKLDAKLALTYGGGFFGNLVGSAAVKNVTFDNITIESTLKNDAGRIKGNVYGVVSGYAYGNVTFENVAVSNSSVKAYGKVGAVLGMAAEPGESVTTFKNVTVNNTKVCGTYNCATLCGTLQNKISITDCSGTATWVPNALDNDSNWNKYGSVPGCAGTYAIDESKPYYCVAWADKYVKFYADDGKIGSELADGIPVCVAMIGEKKYPSFDAALEAAKKDSNATTAVTIDLMADVTVAPTTAIGESNKAVFMIESGDSVVINGNGHKFVVGSIYYVKNSANKGGYVFNVRGKAVFNNVIVERASGLTGAICGGIVNVASGDAELNNCTMDLIDGNKAAGETWGAFPVNTSDNSVVTVNGGVYTGGKANGEDNKGFSIGKDTSVLVFNSGTTNGIHVDSCAATVTVVDGKFNGTQPLRVDGKNSSAKNVSVSGGLFAARPDSKCIASGKAILVNDDAATKTAYPFQVAEAPTAVTVAEVTKGENKTESKVDTNTTKPGSTKKFTADEVTAATEARQAITTNTNSADLNVTGVGVEVAATQVAQKNTVKGADTTFTTDTGATSMQSLVEAVKATASADTNDATAENIAIVVQTYTEVEVVDVTLKDSNVNNIQSITYDIQPMVQKIATTETIADNAKINAAAIKTEGEAQNAVKVGQPEKLEVTEPVNMTIPLPEIFVDGNGNKYADRATLYVKHVKEDGTTYIYEGTVTNNDTNYSVSFVNPNGFSAFTVSGTDETVAMIGSVKYGTLASAVAAVQDGQAIELKKDSAESITVGRTVNFTLTANGGNFNGSINAGANTTINKTGDVYTFTYTEPAPTRRGGSSAPVADTKSFTTSFDGINAVYVDGKLVDSKYYTVSGKTVTLTEEFLKTLGNGQHSFRAESATMKGESTFTVTSSKTGDMGVVLYAALALASVTGSAIVIGKKKEF